VYQASYPTATTTYSYNTSTGRLSSIVDPAGTTKYTYTANGQLYQLTEPFSKTPVTYTYDTAGRITKRTDGAGLCWTQTYETGTGRPDKRTIRVNGSSCSSTILGTFDLGYDISSNVTSRAETVTTETGANNADSGTWTYAYDAANRMSSSTTPAPSSTVTTYGYDGAGNRTSVKVGSGSPVTTDYDAAGVPTSSSDGTTYMHDAIGELTQIDRAGGTANDWNLVYDSWGNTKSAAHEPTGTPDVSYTLDALDRVLSRTAGGTSTSYTYQGTGEDVAKAQVGAATPVFYAFSPGGPLAQRTGTDATTLRYFVKDLHGDVVGLAATTGTNPMKGSILYSPWGVPGTKTGEFATFPAQGHLGFQGQLTDALTGQVDMLTRYYEPTLGQFTKRDVLFGEPTAPTSLNQFVYGADSPVTFTDPTGMFLLGDGGGGGSCSRACMQSLDEAYDDYVASHLEQFTLPSGDLPHMPPIMSFYKVMANPRLPTEQRVAAAKFVYAHYGEQGRDIAWNWLEGQRLAQESSAWWQVRHDFRSSLAEGLSMEVRIVDRAAGWVVDRTVFRAAAEIATHVGRADSRQCGDATCYDNANFFVWPDKAAITVGTRIFCRGVCSEQIIVHENVHVAQQKNQGISFIPRYYGQALILARGFDCDNTWEEEAYTAARQPCNYG
jgi:RHS repeat-associated protein